MFFLNDLLSLKNAPKIAKAFTVSLQDLKPKYSFIITHSSDDYIIRDNIRVCNLYDFLNKYVDTLAQL